MPEGSGTVAGPVSRTATEPRAAATRRLFAPLWLLLAAILTHALIPSGSPLARTAGSAFSATTLDVSLAPRKSEQLLGIGDADNDRSDGAADGGDPFIANIAPGLAARQFPFSSPPGSHRATTPAPDPIPRTGQPRAPPMI